MNAAKLIDCTILITLAAVGVGLSLAVGFDELPPPAGKPGFPIDSTILAWSSAPAAWPKLKTESAETGAVVLTTNLASSFWTNLITLDFGPTNQFEAVIENIDATRHRRFMDWTVTNVQLCTRFEPCIVGRTNDFWIVRFRELTNEVK